MIRAQGLNPETVFSGEPRDALGLAFLRIGFGLVLLFGTARTVLGGKVFEYYVEPSYHFSYLGFDWVRPLPEPALYVLFAVLGMAAVFVTLGAWYRLATAVFGLGFAYVFLLEKARYLNHHYLILLVVCLLIFVPAHHAFSLWSRKHGARSVPSWAIALLRIQVGLVYLFAGIAKLNVDWLRARPLDQWLASRSDLPLLGPLLAMHATAWVFSYAGLLLDLAAWPLLAWRKTRHFTFLMVVSFHLINAAVFDIGVFPWAMIVLTTIYFEPDWPRRLPFMRPEHRARIERVRPRRVVGLCSVWVLVQVLVPLRHLLYPGSVHWTEEGHRFSWHMKLRDKQAVAIFRVLDPATGEEWIADPALELVDWQVRKMSARPDMIHGYARHLARDRWPERGPLEVRATVFASLNGRPPRQLIDPSVDLAREPAGLAAASWILPLR